MQSTYSKTKKGDRIFVPKPHETIVVTHGKPGTHSVLQSSYCLSLLRCSLESGLSYEKAHPITLGYQLITAYADKGTKSVDLDERLSVAITAGEFGYDAGVGIEVGTPAFLSTKLRVRVKANMIWLQSYKAAFDHWATYSSVSASLVYNIISIERSIVYIEIGTHVMLPEKTFSDVTHVHGVNSLMGVDLFVVNAQSIKLSYFFSGGFLFTNARAEKLEGNPGYAKGFLFSNGFRIYF